MIYEQKDITTQGKNGPQIVSAQVASNGLAYHRTLIAPLEEMIEPEDKIAHDRLSQCWTVTHVASGHSICWETHTFDNETQCQDFIRKVDSMCNWSAIIPTKNKKLQQQIQHIAIQCQTFEITYL